MSQHDYDLANQTRTAFRADLNNALLAAVSQNSGATEPATMFAYQFWADTTTGLLKIRNAANSAWVTVGTLASTNLGLAPLAGATFTGLVNLKKGADIASATTINLSTATGNLVHITGTTTTTGVTMTSGQQMRCIADAAWPLTYHATNLRLNGADDYICTAGDTIDFFYDGTTVFANVTRKNGTPVALSRVSVNASDNTNNLTAAGNYFKARINSTGSDNIYASGGFGTTSVVTEVTGSSCTVDLYYNNTTAYMQQTLTFPEAGTYLVFNHVVAGTYLTNYRNVLDAFAIRVA